MPLTMAEERSKRQNSLLRKQLGLAVRRVQWSYAIFWSSSLTQPEVLEWGEGYYNGDMKKRKKSYEANHKDLLQRSKLLRKLYLSMLEGDNGTNVSTTHDDHRNRSCDKKSMMLSPDDLSDEEWYYLVSMSYVFSPSQCLPGRSSETGETIWLCNAQYAESKLFSRSLLARSASIQTVVCFPYLGGVIELGVTELISKDQSLIQQIKSCLMEISVNKMGIRINEEKDQLQLEIPDEDLHYKRTLSTVLNYSANRSSRNNKTIHHVSSESGSSFLRWKQCEQPNSGFVQKQTQNVLRKMLYNVPLMQAKRMFQSQNQDDPNSDRRKENEKFSVLRTMVPTVNEVDKESILNNTIKYLQELEARVEELESCMGSVNFVETRRKKNLNESVLIEETSGNYDDNNTKIIDENSGETEQATVVKDKKTHLKVKLKETEVVIEVRCSYRDYIVADIMETLSNLHMDAFSVRSQTHNKFLTFVLKAKFRGEAVASVGMIKRELRKVIGDLV